MVEETGELWHSPAGAGDWRRVQVDQDQLGPGMRPSSWSYGFTTFSSKIIEAMREGRTSVEDAATFEDGHRAQLVMDAARESNDSGCFVKVG